MRCLMLFLMFVAHLAGLNGQTTIEGRIVNTKGEAIPNINILIYPKDRDVLISFAVSDKSGNWRATVNSAADSLDVATSSVHYRNERKRIANLSQWMQFNLDLEIKELDAFTIRAPDIDRRGDTISYLVSSFARGQNRSIADVLKNLPGIEVQSSGLILYQGEPINRFYVEGLDLMGGRYGLISNNLPHRSVATVEILENHQPIRILEERVVSYQAALNLKLKNEVTTTGTASLGAGMIPLLWDANITPMTFSRKFQVANSYQANNTGNDAARQLSALTLQDMRNRADRPRENPEMLGIQSMIPPDFNENRYLNNNIHLINSNALLRLSKDYQLRANLYYIHDNQQQQGIRNRTIYTPLDTLNFSESLENRLNDHYLQGEFTLNRNIKDNYLDNKLKIHTRWDNRNGRITINDQLLGQSLKLPLRNISNELRSVKPTGNHLIELKSFVSYDHSPQQLIISPGQYEHLLNFGEPFDGLKQNLELHRLYSDHSAGFSFSWKGISIRPRAGISYRWQRVDSSLLKQIDDEWHLAPISYANCLESDHLRTYLNTEFSYRIKDVSLTAALPIGWQRAELYDANLMDGQEINRLVFDPRISTEYKFGGLWRIRASWAYSASLGDLDGVHYGYILKNHQSLQQNAAPLSESRRHNFSTFLSYRNPFASFFNSLSYSFIINDNNLIFRNQIQPDGTGILQAYELPNTAYFHIVSGETSKYFDAAKSTLSLRVSLSHNKRKSLLNQQLFETENRFISIRPQANVRITEWLNAEYKTNFSFINTYIASSLSSNISMMRHYLDLNGFIDRNHYLGLTTEYYRYRESDFLFADLLYRYTIRKHRIDIEARWMNIFNTSTYLSFQSTAYTVSELTYFLRPSQLLFSVRFGFPR